MTALGDQLREAREARGVTLPEAERDPFIDRVLEAAGRPLVLAYVRLNMTAVRP